MEYIAYNNCNNNTYDFKAKNDSEARHWIINHLDMSNQWYFKRKDNDN